MNKFQRRVNFCDADPAGIMFFSRVFEFCHSAYEEWMSGLGLARDYFTDPEITVPLIHAEADYIKPIKPGETITIEILVEKIGGSSFTLNYIVYNSKNEKAAAVKTAHVFINKSSFTKCAVPEEFRGKTAVSLS